MDLSKSGWGRGRGTIFRAALAKKLSNYILYRQLLHVDIRDGTGAQ